MNSKQLEELRDADNAVKDKFCREYLPWCQSEYEFYAALDEAIEAAKFAEIQHNPGALP